MAYPLTPLLAAAAYGCYFAYTGGRRLKPLFHILSNDPLPVRKLHEHRGPVEIEGRAVEGDGGTVEAPFTGTECLAYSYEVEQERDTVHNRKEWDTLDTGLEGGEFIVDDGTGRVVVDPDGADIHAEAYTETVYAGDEPPEPLAECIADNDAVEPQGAPLALEGGELTSGWDQRFTEHRIDVDDSVYVYGQSRRDTSAEWGESRVDALVADGDATPVFVISDTDERGAAWRVARDPLRRTGLGLGLLTFVVALTLAWPI